MSESMKAQSIRPCMVCGKAKCANVAECARQYVRDFWKA